MFKPAVKLTLIVLWVLFCFPFVWFASLIKKYQWRDEFMQRACIGIMKLAGIQLTVHGEFSEKRPLLVVSNHLSYMDIMILSSQANMHFTPKSEIARWPFIGFVCKITDCVFVDRKPGKVKETSAKLREMLDKGKAISFFPEATTGSGVHLLPFKSSFFSLAEEKFDSGPLMVQPVAITYTHVSNLPMDISLWHKIAWVGDEDLLPHVWEFLKLSPIKAELHFLPPVTMEGFAGRKELAAHCRQLIENKIDDVRTQRHVAVLPQKAPSVFLSLRGKSK